MHHASFMAKEVYVRYKIIFGIGLGWVDRQDEIKDWIKIHECVSASEPYMLPETEIYLEDIRKSVMIQKISRTPEGGYVYWLDYVVREIVDDETEASKEEAHRRLDEIMERYSKPGKITPVEPPQKRAWWRRLFSC